MNTDHLLKIKIAQACSVRDAIARTVSSAKRLNVPSSFIISVVPHRCWETGRLLFTVSSEGMQSLNPIEIKSSLYIHLIRMLCSTCPLNSLWAHCRHIPQDAILLSYLIGRSVAYSSAHERTIRSHTHAYIPIALVVSVARKETSCPKTAAVIGIGILSHNSRVTAEFNSTGITSNGVLW